MNWFKHPHAFNRGNFHWWFGVGYEPDFTLQFNVMLCPVHGELWMEFNLGCFYLKAGASR
jgi:hypothetical protein